jgi:hypothetical protein
MGDAPLTKEAAKRRGARVLQDSRGGNSTVGEARFAFDGCAIA